MDVKKNKVADHERVKGVADHERSRMGFTLVELVVVIAVIALMTTISAVAISSVRRERQVQIAAEQIRNMIIEAHAYSLSPASKGEGEYVGVVISEYLLGSPQFVRVQHGRGSAPKIIIDKGFSENVRVLCERNTDEIAEVDAEGNPIWSNPCIRFEASNSNTIGQTLSIAEHGNHLIKVSNAAGTEMYTLTVDPISGSVTMKKEL